MVDVGNKGCIINISSISGTITMPKGIGYGASKAALNKWTKHAALDLAKYGIRVNTIAPGVIESGMNEDTATTNPELWNYLLNNIPYKDLERQMTLLIWLYFLLQKKQVGLQVQFLRLMEVMLFRLSYKLME